MEELDLAGLSSQELAALLGNGQLPARQTRFRPLSQKFLGLLIEREGDGFAVTKRFRDEQGTTLIERADFLDLRSALKHGTLWARRIHEPISSNGRFVPMSKKQDAMTEEVEP